MDGCLYPFQVMCPTCLLIKEDHPNGLSVFVFKNDGLLSILQPYMKASLTLIIVVVRR